MVNKTIPKDFWIRAVSGGIYVAIIVITLLLRSGLPYLILFSFFAFIAVFEYNRMSKQARTKPLSVILDASAVVWVLMMGYFISAHMYGTAVWVPVVAFILFVLSRSVLSNDGNAFNIIFNSLFPMFYIGLPFFLATLVSFRYNYFTSEVHFSGIRVLSVFLIVWANDTFAYLTGTFFGKHLLSQRHSPHKTVEGFIGGLLGSMLCAGLLYWFLPSHFGIFGFGIILFYGLLLGVLSTIGDLFESMLKRNAGVKDAGTLIPGHGGVLDRLDSFLFAIAGAFIIISPYSPF